MAVAQYCFSTKRNLDSKRPHIFIPLTPPTDSLALINHTDVIYTDTQTPHLLQKGKNGLSARAKEDAEEPMQDQKIQKGHKLKLATKLVNRRKRELFQQNKLSILFFHLIYLDVLLYLLFTVTNSQL